MKRYPQSSAASQQGAILLEALIAVLLFSLGVLALAGLQSTMIKNTDDAKYRAEASFVAQQVLSDIWLGIGGTNLGDHVVTDKDISQLLPAGKYTVSVAADRVVTVKVDWTLPGNATHSYSAYARVEGKD